MGEERDEVGTEVAREGGRQEEGDGREVRGQVRDCEGVGRRRKEGRGRREEVL